VQPALGHPRGHQVALVEQQQQVLVARVAFQVLLQVAAARAGGVARIQHLQEAQQSQRDDA
jgi:hypothetical protein